MAVYYEESWGSHGCDYEEYCFLGCNAMVMYYGDHAETGEHYTFKNTFIRWMTLNKMWR
jgi:hypothetical protein